MSEFRVASRYAKSLLDLAQEQGKLEEVNRDMQLFEKVGKENREFLLLLKNPIITHDKKLSILRAIFKGRVNDLTLAMFEIIVKKQREAILFSVSKEFHNLYNIVKGIENAEVISVTPLTEQLRSRFKEIIKREFGKEVELHEKVDKELIGGYILKVGDKQIDESIKGKLQTLKRQFSFNTPYIREI
jgi:F-type H+-transporting ATPase subunit delta